MQERLTVAYENHSDRFSKQTEDFTKQYCSVYTVRLRRMRDFLKARIKKKWGERYPVCELHKLSESSYDKCVVIGTLYKNQKLKPSVLKQLAEANSLTPQPVQRHFVDPSDALFIEDELQRYHLLGALSPVNLVTGISCALLGSDFGKGKFTVDDWCFAGFRFQIERPLLQDDAFVVFISGLDLVHIEKTALPLRLFVHWIAGLLGDCNDIDVSKIVRLVVAGNSTCIVHEKVKQTMSLTSRTAEIPEIIESVKTLDTFLFELAQVMEVDVMPGEHDPSNHILPQQAMHNCMFPKSRLYKSLNQVSNPYECQVGGAKILGTSGQPILNILAFSNELNAIDALEHCLDWSHLAPTAPDTLGCYPFYDQDPFVIGECPHVLFSGNMDSFQTRMSQGDEGQRVRLICIPEFANSFTVAVLNLKNLDCVPVTFKSF